jgi:hypothetical protein
MFRWTSHGRVKYEEEVYEHDVWIDLDQVAHKRENRNIIDREELASYFTDEVVAVVVGTGQLGSLKLTEDAMNLIIGKKLELHKYETPQAIKTWNEIANTRATIAIIHVF